MAGGKVNRRSPARSPLTHAAIRSTRPIEREMRWLAYVRPDGQPVMFATEADKVSDLAKLVTSRGCKFLGSFKTSSEASEATRPAPTQEEQSAEIIAGLTASIIGEELRKKGAA